MIDAGAEVNLATYWGRHDIMITPLEYAIHTKMVNAVPYLLSRGAIIPPMSEWPTNPKMYKALREQKMKDGFVDVPHLSTFKQMSDSERAAL